MECYWNVKEFGFYFVSSSEFLRHQKRKDRHDQNILFFLSVKRSRETNLDAVEVAHVVEGYKNQHAGDRNGNRKEERVLKHHVKKGYYFPLTATVHSSSHSILPQQQAWASQRIDQIMSFLTSTGFPLQLGKICGLQSSTTLSLVS